VSSLAWVTFLNFFRQIPIQVPGGINPAGRRFFQKSFAPGDFIQFVLEFTQGFAGRGLNWEIVSTISALAGFGCSIRKGENCEPPIVVVQRRTARP
jgi:hypothetical protein